MCKIILHEQTENKVYCIMFCFINIYAYESWIWSFIVIIKSLK